MWQPTTNGPASPASAGTVQTTSTRSPDVTTIRNPSTLRRDADDRRGAGRGAVRRGLGGLPGRPASAGSPMTASWITRPPLMTWSRTVSPGHQVQDVGQVRVVLRDQVDLARGGPRRPATIGGVAGRGRRLAARPAASPRATMAATHRAGVGSGASGGVDGAATEHGRPLRRLDTASRARRSVRRPETATTSASRDRPPPRSCLAHPDPTIQRPCRRRAGRVRRPVRPCRRSMRRRFGRTTRQGRAWRRPSRSTSGPASVVSGGRRHRPRDLRRRVLLDARPVRLGQDDDPAHDRRLRAADQRAASCSTART